MEKLIETYLTLNFEELYKLVYPFTPDGQGDSSKEAQEDLVTKDSVQHLKAAELESMGKDFLKNYKQKVEQIIKDIRGNVSNTSFQLDASKKQQKSQTRKELTTRLIRILMLHFTTYIEIVSKGKFGNESQFLKQVVSNTTQRNQVLLDLKNF